MLGEVLRMGSEICFSEEIILSYYYIFGWISALLISALLRTMSYGKKKTKTKNTALLHV